MHYLLVRDSKFSSHGKYGGRSCRTGTKLIATVNFTSYERIKLLLNYASVVPAESYVH